MTINTYSKTLRPVVVERNYPGVKSKTKLTARFLNKNKWWFFFWLLEIRGAQELFNSYHFVRYIFEGVGILFIAMFILMYIFTALVIINR